MAHRSGGHPSALVRPGAVRAAVVTASMLVLAAWAVAALQESPEGLRAQARAALSQISGEIVVDGPEQPVEVIRDRWGIPHIYAKSVPDLFFAQGYVAAQDRLWQLDLWRRTADGRLSEILGPSAIARDTFARLLKYRGDMALEWASYHPDARLIIEAFVRGINAQIATVLSDPARLPIEFQLTGTKPGAWTPEVVISRMAGYIMTRNARTEIQRAMLAWAVGPDRVPEFMPTDPPAALTIPDGLALDGFTDEILAIAAGAGDAVDFSLLGRDAAPPTATPRSARFFRRPGFADGFGAPEAARTPVAIDEEAGSNDWVVSGALTASRKPLLANDPHRPILLPSLRYTVHLNGPGWNVIGAGEPALPGVAAGHNDRIAFGFTIVGIDQQDIYVETLDPADPDHYFFQGRSEAMRVEHERLAVRGEPPRDIDLRFTRHGPILHIDRARNRAYALRWVGTEPGTAGYLRSLALDTAEDWPQFLKALEGWKVPSENLVYADLDGNIGWVAAGLAPVRPNWNGLLPVPGHEGKYEWDGFVKVAELPQLFNPASGFVATANHNILPPGYSKVLGYEWTAPYRFSRIVEVLTAPAAVVAARDPGSTPPKSAEPYRRAFTVADFERLQHDETSVVARAVCSALSAAMSLRADLLGPAARPMADESRLAAGVLTSWDHVVRKDSGAAALYEIWMPKLVTALQDAVTSPADRPYTAAQLSTDRLLALLETAKLLPSAPVKECWVDGSPRPPALAAARAQAGRPVEPRVVVDILTGATLGEAWREALSRLGQDRRLWAWGAIHRAVFDHPLALTPARREVLNLGDVPRGGDGTTPNSTGNGPRQASGASYREVIDLADWDQSTTINVPGLSGQPTSPYYGNLLPLWAEGRYHPLAFSRKAVEKYAASRLILVPPKRGSGR